MVTLFNFFLFTSETSKTASVGPVLHVAITTLSAILTSTTTKRSRMLKEKQETSGTNVQYIQQLHGI